jgi:CO/xanthine dehydrogenase FAD-binding subunit
MLLNLREYHRPLAATSGQRQALDRVLGLLARRAVHTAVLAGGDALIGSADPALEAVVDLQGTALDTIATEGTSLAIGAMVTRSQLAADGPVTQLYHGIVAEGARRWGGSLQRNRATVGGAVVVAASNDPLVAALLACDAMVIVYGQEGWSEIALNDFIPQRAALLGAPHLVTGLSIPSAAAGTGAALATVARTPADAPILLAVARLSVDKGICQAARLVVGGTSRTPERLVAVENELQNAALAQSSLAAAATRAAERVRPDSDILATAEYRRAMVAVLGERALQQAWARAARGTARSNDAA